MRVTRSSLAALAVLVASAHTSRAEPQPRIVVPEVAVSGTTQDVGNVVTELVLEALLNRHCIRALGPSDLRDMLDTEKQKQLLGCDKESCMAQIAGAMGAERLISGLVGKLGDTHVVTLKLIDTRSAEVSARATRKFQKIDEVPDAIGPLVDELLGAQPKPKAALPPALRTPAETARAADVMSVDVFCKRAKAYAQRLVEQGYDKSVVGERRALLDDLLHTPFLKEFGEKEGCIRSPDARVSNAIGREVLRSDTPEHATDLRRRHVEWREMMRLVDLLDEAYRTGFEKEKNGAGARPSSLPFDVVAKEPEQPDPTPATKRYLDDYASAEQTVARALEAAKKKDLPAFSALFTPDDPKHSRNTLDYSFKQATQLSESGYAVDLCPSFIRSSREIEQSAQRYQKDGVLDGCIRKRRDDSTSTDTIRLKNIPPKGWLIWSW
jgi:hypothetical protein